MHSITVSAYLPFYKSDALDRLWFAHILAMAYVDVQFDIQRTMYRDIFV